MEIKKTNAVQTTQPVRPSAVSLMAKRINVEADKLYAALKGTCFKGATDEQMLALIVVANEYGLNPFLKEMYAFPAQGGGIVPIVSVDGWIKIVNRAPDFAGMKFEMDVDEGGKPISCTCVIHLKGKEFAVEVTEYYDECYRKTQPWDMMPKRMLRHKAMIQAARLAFGFAGIQDEDEAIDVQSFPVPEPAALKALGSARHDNGEGSDLGPVETKPKSAGSHQQLSALLDESKIHFTRLQEWADQTDFSADFGSYASVGDIPEEVVTRLLRVKKEWIKALSATAA